MKNILKKFDDVDFFLVMTAIAVVVAIIDIYLTGKLNAI